MKNLAVIFAGTAVFAASLILSGAGAKADPQDYGNFHSRYESRYEGYDDYGYEPRYKPRPRSYDNCKATIRATGLGNVLPAIARVNAIYAWRREVQSVYGYRADWTSAKAKSISCEGVGLTTRCTARGRPCL